MRGQRSEVIRITLIHTPLKHCYGLTLQRDEARAVSTLPCDQDIVALQRMAGDVGHRGQVLGITASG